MRRVSGRKVAALLVLAWCTMTVQARECRLERLGESALTLDGGHLALDVLINDKMLVSFVLDTGAARTMLGAPLATYMGLPVRQGAHTFIRGLDGISGNATRSATATRFTFSGVKHYDVPIAVGDLIRDGGPSTVGILGSDRLRGLDMELDVAQKQLTLHKASDCESGFVPWTSGHEAVALEEHSGMPVVPVVINGVELKMMLDTGATRTLVSRSGARKLGLDAAKLVQDGARPSGNRGVNGELTRSWVYRPERVAVGAVARNRLPVHVTEVRLDDFDGLLGLDFFKDRRIWLSYPRRMLFLERKG